jgi:hypothetical protein
MNVLDDPILIGGDRDREIGEGRRAASAEADDRRDRG